MGTNRTLQPVAACAKCDGPMPSPLGRGRPAIYCSGACRKAAFEARRTGKPDAFEIKVIERVVVTEHDLTSCVDHTISSPAGCRRVIHALAQLGRDGVLTSDPKWESTQLAIGGLLDALYAPTLRGRR